MKKIPSKSILTSAIAGAILATGLMSTPSFAAPGDVSPKGVGDVLLFPYYTTQNNFQTLIHLVNTSSTNTVIAKVRFRDYADSKDAMDFTVILSPNDVFSGYVKDMAGTTTFVKTDNSCTSPLATNNMIPFPSSAQDDKKHTGHIEVIVEGTMNNAAVKAAAAALPVVATTLPEVVAKADVDIVNGALHSSSGVPADCATVDSYFREGAIAGSPDITDISKAANLITNAASDVLSGHFVVQDANGGVSGGGRPIALKDTVKNIAATAQPCGGAGANLICGQFPDHYPFPNLMNVTGTILAGNAPAGGVSNAKIIALMEATLAAEFDNMNEWSAISKNGVSTEMPVTQPFKYLHRDKEPATINVDSNTFFSGVTTYYKTSTIASNAGTALATADANAWDDVDGLLSTPAIVATAVAGTYDSNGCIDYNLNLVDREEQNGPSAGTSASGAAGPQTGKFCNETTVVTFGGGITNADGTTVAATYNTLNKATGTASVDLQNGANLVPAVVGYSMWKRSFGTVDKNFSHLMPNM